MKVMVEINTGWIKYEKVKCVSIDNPVYGGLLIRLEDDLKVFRHFPKKSYKSVEIR